MSHLCAARLTDNGNTVTVEWADGMRSRFHAFWLRDNALDAETRAPANGQRLVTLNQQPEQIRISAADLHEGELRILFEPENKEVRFPGNWLRECRYDLQHLFERGWVKNDIEVWDCSLQDRVPDSDYASIATDREQLRQWLASIRRYGFARITNSPTEDGFVCQWAQLFGYVRETNYGRYFDVRAVVNPSNLAGTSLGLQAHTDNPYRDPAPTLQLLHCLENTTDGGESIVVDGFKAALRLKLEHPHSFDLLSGYCARFEYAGANGVHLRARRPMIELAPDGEIITIRFNNRSTAPITDVPYEQMPDYYQAYRRFANIVDDPDMGVRFKLDAGEGFLVDNTRVMHSRSEFSSSGTRWLQGCYADKDGLLSTLSVLED